MTQPAPQPASKPQASLASLIKLAIFARDSGHYEEAIELLAMLHGQLPDNIDIHANLARTLFYARHWPQAWQAFDVRFRLMEHPPTVTRRKADGSSEPMPRWTSGPIPPSLLVMAEQGLGDSIQFAAYLPRLCETGCKVTLVAPQKLHGILKTVDPRLTLVIGEQPGSLANITAWTCLLDIPRALGLAEPELMAKTPYIRAETSRRARWALRLPRSGLRIGIVWQGNPKAPVDANRSAPLWAFGPLAQLPGVHLVSLQKGPGEEQLQKVPFADKITTLQGLDDGPDAFLDTAAVIAELDMVVTVDTAVAHVAAALGKSTIIILHESASDWRWLHGTETSVFYPTVHLVRKTAGQGWESAIHKVAHMLKGQLETSGGKSSAPAPQMPLSVGDLIDRITILRIKAKAITKAEQRANVRHELELLEGTYQALALESAAFSPLTDELQRVNQALWNVEDMLRECEREQRFDDEFIELARSVYHINDRRAALKKQLNQLAGSAIVEEKSYASY